MRRDVKDETHIIHPQGKIKNWFVGSLFAFCFVVSLSAQQTDQAETEYYARGMRAIQLGLYDEAIGAFQQVLRLNPQSAEAYCELGAAYRLKEKNRPGVGGISPCSGIASVPANPWCRASLFGTALPFTRKIHRR